MYPELQDCDYYPDYCRECDDHQSKLLDLGYWMKGILECLYSNDPLDTLEFEHCMQEMCYILGMNLPHEPLLIAKVTRQQPKDPRTELSMFIKSMIAINKQNKQPVGAI